MDAKKIFVDESYDVVHIPSHIVHAAASLMIDGLDGNAVRRALSFLLGDQSNGFQLIEGAIDIAAHRMNVGGYRQYSDGSGEAWLDYQKVYGVETPFELKIAEGGIELADVAGDDLIVADDGLITTLEADDENDSKYRL